MDCLTTKRYKRKYNTREYHYGNVSHLFQTNVLNLELLEQLIVYMVLNSLHEQFSQSKAKYNCQNNP